MALQIRTVAMMLLSAFAYSNAWSQQPPTAPPTSPAPRLETPEKPEPTPVSTPAAIAPLPAAPAASPEQIAEWVRQLDSVIFADREEATLRLVQAGGNAIEPVAEILDGRNLEVTMRALHVLRSIALSGDEATQEKAQTALEKAVESGKPAVVRRAEAALAGVAEIRQARTIDGLQRLGARFSSATSPFGLQLEDDITEVEIGAEWQGEEKDLRRLRFLSDIHKVTFSGPLVTDSWLKVIGGMQNVSELRVKRAKITDEGIAAIKDLPKLQQLSLRYMPISDKSVPHLASLKSLQKLEIYGTDISTAGAQQLRGDLETTKLDFRRGGFLGIGGQDHLLGYQIFRVQENSAAANAKIEVEDILIKFDDDKIRTFEELTNRIAKNRAGDTVTLTIARNTYTRTLGIVHEADETLGLITKPHVIGLELSEIDPKSVAGKSGLRVGDIIVAYKKIRLTDADQLKELFAANQPGQVYELEFVRGAQIQKIQVTLGEWD